MKLTLSNCIRLSEVIIHRIFKECHHLVEFNVSRCSNIRRLKLASQKLEKLDISWLSCSIELDCPNLKNLKCAYSHIKDNDLLKMVMSCHELEWLDLSGWTPTIVFSINDLVEHCQNLKTFIVRDCRWFATLDLNQLMKLSCLEELNVSGNVRIGGIVESKSEMVLEVC